MRAILFALCLLPATAAARRGDLRLSLEPGLAALSDGAERSWGWLGGASLGLGLAELVGLEAHVDAKRFERSDVLVYGGAVTYALDVLPVTPVFALGYARTELTARGVTAKEDVAILGVSVDAHLWRWATVGLVFRYYPLFDTDVFAPAYSSFNLRLGFFWGDP
jgi:hypothetical protein